MILTNNFQITWLIDGRIKSKFKTDNYSNSKPKKCFWCLEVFKLWKNRTSSNLIRDSSLSTPQKSQLRTERGKKLLTKVRQF